MEQLENIYLLKGNIELLSGLHIGGGDTELKIGGIDSQVIKNPLTGKPYIPGSSIKGKIRSLLEWKAGVVGITGGSPVQPKHLVKLEGDQKQAAEAIIKLFGFAPDGKEKGQKNTIGPTRLAFWDANLSDDWLAKAEGEEWTPSEEKAENSINRIAGTAESPRFIERVPAGVEFSFKLTLKLLDGDDKAVMQAKIFEGMKLLEMDSLGGSGSRGYGKIKFNQLQWNNEAAQDAFDKVVPF